MQTPIETISSLHTKIADAAKGYEEAASIGNHTNVKALCADLRQRHMTHAHELAGLLLARGGGTDGDGSLMSVVHKAALNVRFAMSADETSLLPGLRDGEKRLLAAYDDTLRECEIDKTFSADEVSVIKKQRESIVEHVGKIDALQTSLTAEGEVPG